MATQLEKELSEARTAAINRVADELRLTNLLTADRALAEAHEERMLDPDGYERWAKIGARIDKMLALK